MLLLVPRQYYLTLVTESLISVLVVDQHRFSSLLPVVRRPQAVSRDCHSLRHPRDIARVGGKTGRVADDRVAEGGTVVFVLVVNQNTWTGLLGGGLV